MKIALLCTPSDLHAVKWAKALSHAGADVHFYCPSPIDNNDPELNLYPVSGRKKNQWDYLDFWWSAPALKKYLKTGKYTIVNALHVSPFGLWGYWANARPLISMALGADILEYTHNLPHSIRWHAESKGSIFLKYCAHYWHSYQVKKILRKSDLVLADNQAILSAAKQLNPASDFQPEIFTWGVDTQKFYPLQADEKAKLRMKYGISQSATVILCPRGFKALYRPDLILDAMEKYHLPGLHWILLKGNYPFPENLSNQLKLMHSDKYTLIREMIPEHTIQELWQISDGMLSLPAYDGLSASVLQAFATQVFPILSPIPANKEFTQQGFYTGILENFSPGELWRNIAVLSETLNTNEHKKLLEHNHKQVLQNAEIKTQSYIFLDRMQKRFYSVS